MDTEKTQDKQLVVLASFRRSRSTTNPYIIMLAESIEALERVTLHTFSWREALCGRYDVFHAHWPEILLEGATRPRRVARLLLYSLLLIKLRVGGVAVVRTVHNLQLPKDLSRPQRVLLRLTERFTTLRIVLNDTTPVNPGDAYAIIPHGHYRDWFAGYAREQPRPGALSFFGLIRQYKRVDLLLRAFRQTAEETELYLRIAGKPSTPQLQKELVELAGDDPRVQFRFEYLDDAELVREVTQAELVVLPYREMHNSGAALTALSLDRPVLMLENEFNRQLRGAVGADWVHLYAGELTGDEIVRVLDKLRRQPASAPPNLSSRDWSIAAPEHERAYRRAVEIISRKRPRSTFGRPAQDQD